MGHAILITGKIQNSLVKNNAVFTYINLQLSVTYEISYKITTTSFSIIKFLLLHYNIRLVRYFCSQVLMYSIEGSLNFPAYVSLHQLSEKKKKKKKKKKSSGLTPLF